MFIMGLQDTNHNHDDNDDTNVQQTRKLRLIIHTSNLQRNDLEQKAQGAYIEEFPFQSSDPDSAKPRKSTNRTCDFENDLVSYIETYKYNKTHQWWWNGGDHGEQQRKLVDEIRRYDFSKTRAVLILSTPGWYSYSDRPRGYLKLSKAIRDHYSSNNNSDASTNSSSTTTTRASRQEGHNNNNNSTTTTTTTTTPIVCQFSSIGSLNQKWLQDFAESLDTAQNKCRNLTDDVLRLVYPTSEEIRSSVEGYVGGASVPGTAKNVEKSILKPLFCRWAGAKTDHHHRGRRRHPLHKPSNVPHIKTYYQLTEDSQGMKWFCLTSHNLSKAAWGEKQNTKFGAKLMMRHWELGVVIFPVGGPKQKLVSVATAAATTMTTVTKTTGNADEEHCNEDSLSANEIPLPFQIHPTAYGISDLPWAVDRVYKEPDKYGRRSIQG
mmetsp:Transcript_8649/g.12561  ORF Transcript_8649/g.12561 Transcript_8649/m.12561 type:complete len:435 (-) Transcript_8649:28-1332(-)